MEKKKISLSVFISVLAVLIIIIMAGFIYMQKINSDREISGLKNDSEELKATVTELQEKLDSISDIANTSNETEKVNETSNNSKNEEFDVEISISEIEKINSLDNSQIKDFYDKYSGKIIKITGYVTNFGQSEVIHSGNEPETYINIGNRTTYKDKTYAGGYTTNTTEIEKINNLKAGQNISIIGILDNDLSWPIDLSDVKIVQK